MSGVLTLAKAVATPWFVVAYGSMLIILTLAVLLRYYIWMESEKISAAQILSPLHTPNAMPSQKLRFLNRLTDARINTNAQCRDDALTATERNVAQRSALKRATAIWLGAIVSVPFTRHSVEGLRPAYDSISLHMRRYRPKISEVGDTLVRLALLGTFAGLIAALTIASANIGMVATSEEAQNAQTQQFIHDLLASAATKFWISAVGIACALVLRAGQHLMDSTIDAITSRVSLDLDLALNDPDVIRAWCPRPDGGDPIGTELQEIAETIKTSGDWVLSIKKDHATSKAA